MKDWSEFLEEAKKHIPEKIECEIKMISSVSSLTRFANSHIHQNVEEELTDIFLTFHADGKTTNLNLNITSMGSIEDIIKKALSEIGNNPKDSTWPGLTSKENSFNGYKDISPDDPDIRAQKVKEFIEEGQTYNGAGYCCLLYTSPSPRD